MVTGDPFSLAICRFPLTSDRFTGRDLYPFFAYIRTHAGLYANLVAMTLTPFINLLFLIYSFCAITYIFIFTRVAVWCST